MNIRFISTRFHGVLDYIVAIALFFAPVIFGFQNIGGAAVYIPMALGIVLALYSLFTDYELGFFKFLSMPYHLMVDVLAALFLAISPFLFGFVNEAANAWVPHVVVGIAILLVAAVTQTQVNRPVTQRQ